MAGAVAGMGEVGVAADGMAAGGEAAGGGVEVVGAGAAGVGGRVWPSDFPCCHSIIRPRRPITIRRRLIVLRRDTTRHMATSPATTVPVDRHLPTMRIRILACQRDWTPTIAARLTSRSAALVDLRLHAASWRPPRFRNVLPDAPTGDTYPRKHLLAFLLNRRRQ